MPNLAASHATIAGEQRVIRRELQRDATAAAGAVQTSAHDLARWMRLHLQDGVLDGRRFVSEASMRELHSPQVEIPTTPEMRAARLVEGGRASYGLGWQVMDYRGHPLLWHSGNGDGQIAYMALLPADRLGVAVLVNTWSAPMVHGALVSRMIDHYLGYPPRDWAGEALERVPGMVAAQRSAVAALEAGSSGGPPPRSLGAYVGSYQHPLFGPLHVRAEEAGLTLQMGDGGQIADLEHHHDDAFLVRWRDLLFREVYLTMLQFGVEGDAVARIEMQLNRDRIVATLAPGVVSTTPSTRLVPAPRTALLASLAPATGATRGWPRRAR
jgi:hypothetical protein